MNNHKLQLLRAIVKLFQASGRSQAIEQRLEAQYKAEAYYAIPPVQRI